MLSVVLPKILLNDSWIPLDKALLSTSSTISLFDLAMLDPLAIYR